MTDRPTARDCAFGATPDRSPPAAREAHERWLGAVALGGRGYYAAAAAALDRLANGVDGPPSLAAHAVITRAAHLRQLGGHAAARALDARGLRLATAALRSTDRRVITGSGPIPAGPVALRAGSTVGGGGGGERPDDGLDAAAARIDALVGLAADAIGLGDLTAAERLLAVAGPAATAHPSWRPGVRAAWVRAELALVRGRAEPIETAVADVSAALAAARAAGSVRHVLKSRIVLAVVRGAAGAPPDSGIAELDAVGEHCARLGLLPLRWPAALAAADMAVGRAADQAVGRGADAAKLFNERGGASANVSPGGGPSGATRRRHTAGVALSVLEQRSDPLGKRQMGESVWIPPPSTLL